eukprot:297769-Chlamydomonas_euryale.AAC.1
MRNKRASPSLLARSCRAGPHRRHVEGWRTSPGQCRHRRRALWPQCGRQRGRPARRLRPGR